MCLSGSRQYLVSNESKHIKAQTVSVFVKLHFLNRWLTIWNFSSDIYWSYIAPDTENLGLLK